LLTLLTPFLHLLLELFTPLRPLLLELLRLGLLIRRQDLEHFAAHPRHQHREVALRRAHLGGLGANRRLIGRSRRARGMLRFECRADAFPHRLEFALVVLHDGADLLTLLIRQIQPAQQLHARPMTVAAAAKPTAEAEAPVTESARRLLR